MTSWGSVWSLPTTSTPLCSGWHPLFAETNRYLCKYICLCRDSCASVCVHAARFEFAFRHFCCCFCFAFFLCFRFCWISKSCVLISIILIMRSLTCQHTFIRFVQCASSRTHTDTACIRLTTAQFCIHERPNHQTPTNGWRNEGTHSQWNFYSIRSVRRRHAICAVHANIYGKMRYAPLPPASARSGVAICSMLCTENDSNDKRERKKCAFLENDDKSVVVAAGAEREREDGRGAAKRQIWSKNKNWNWHISTSTHATHIYCILISRIDRSVTSSSRDCDIARLPHSIASGTWKCIILKYL